MWIVETWIAETSEWVKHSFSSSVPAFSLFDRLVKENKPVKHPYYI